MRQRNFKYVRGAGVCAILAAGLLGAQAACQVSETEDEGRPVTRDAVASDPVTRDAVAGDPPAEQDVADTTPRGVGAVTISAPAGTPRAVNPLQAERAYGYLNRICALGPRPSGSEGMANQQKLLVEHFEQLGGTVRLQTFRIPHPITKNPVQLGNLIVQWHPERPSRILLCVHYDTRPVPDNPAVPPRQRGKVFVGANDGASGVALLMELAHFMDRVPSRYGVDFLLVDAEEFVFPQQQRQRYFIGSEYFARDYVAHRPAFRYRKAAVLDMIGDRDLQIYQDRNSIWWRDTRPVTEEIWGTAKRLGVSEFVARTHPKMKEPIRDDHLMLHDVGKIPTCELIDFDYPRFPTNVYWHTNADTPDKCSGTSLAKVGWVILEWLRTAN